MSNLIEHLDRQSKFTIIRLSFLLTVLLGLIDYITGPEIGFSIFYLLPIALVTWFTGILWGVAISFVASTVWFLADSLGGHTYSHPAIGYWAANMRLGYFLIVSYLMGTMKNLFSATRQLASTDYLTGITNSRSFYQLATAELARARRYNHPLTVAYIDLDDFKKINDLFGHSTGDSVLHSIAQTIKQNIRPGDLLGRLGGDEFAVLLPKTDSETAKLVLERLRNNLLERMRINRWSVTFSIGAITYIALPEEVEDLIIKADLLMYSVKNSGKNMVKYEVVGDKQKD